MEADRSEGSDKDAVDAGHARNLPELSERLSGLYLHQNADLLRGGRQIIARPPEIAGRASFPENAPAVQREDNGNFVRLDALLRSFARRGSSTCLRPRYPIYA